MDMGNRARAFCLSTRGVSTLLARVDYRTHIGKETSLRKRCVTHISNAAVQFYATRVLNVGPIYVP
jgi:hypothetical protein